MYHKRQACPEGVAPYAYGPHGFTVQCTMSRTMANCCSVLVRVTNISLLKVSETICFTITLIYDTCIQQNN